MAWLCRYPRWSALMLGVVSATGFQPLMWWLLSVVAVGLFAALVFRTDRVRQAAVLGWMFGLGHFTLGNNWIATAFTYQAEMPAFLGWLAVPLLSLYLAVYPALAAGAARLVIMAVRPSGALGWGEALLLAGCWSISEWLRGWVFTGYAWNPLGAILVGPFATPGVAALLPWMGTYALSGLVVLLGAGAIILLRQQRFVTAGVAAVALAIAMYVPWGEGQQGTLPVTLVQPDIRQDDLDNPRLFERQFVATAALSLPQKPGTRRLVLWPESGVPDYLQDGYPQRYYDQMTARGDPQFARKRIGRVIGPGSMLLTGAVDLDIANDRAVAARNVVTAIDAGGNIRGSYAKAHLVPYGEYLPMRWLLEPLGLSRLVAGAFDFVPGPGPRTLDLGQWGRAGIQVCYEIVFSGEVVDPAHRPDYIFNDSNDGWFGSWGPPQHLAQARMRAIEEGLPVLRATTTGISAIIDARGVVRQFLPVHRSGRLDGQVPPASSPTPFALFGNWLAMGWAMLAIASGLLVLRRRNPGARLTEK
ncbi:MAG: apolipoprotein N-acyltransferase [Novosphingobium sp.]